MIFCIILKISLINKDNQTINDFFQRYQTGKKQCIKSRHLTTCIYDPFINCLKNCHKINLISMLQSSDNLVFKQAKNGYKYLGCNKCNI